ncbi:hypothetical protein M407DRAFT_23926 [Tulasnella calospora MUT 4182]|uniref:Uncharacterized protein n=1 Tax=Tulasnella calospora MUT 4182 TaxID=1051891 RepID=A0A0C3KZS5_9AGAM|nr:hypothetical protein M407DRAFT_23926 [Tulasnella calospora MUT 4182]
MDHLLRTYTPPGAWPRNSQTFESGILATYESIIAEEVAYDEAWIGPPRTPPRTAAHRLPAETWMAVCEALRRLDLIDAMKQHELWEPVYHELLLTTRNKNRPGLILTAHSILPLSRTCRYLHRVTSPSLLKNIRLSPFYPISPRGSAYLAMIRQVESLHLNGNQRLRHVRGLAVACPPHGASKEEDKASGGELRNQIRSLLIRLPNLRHLTLASMKLDAPLMQSIPILPLEHLWLLVPEAENPVTGGTLTLTTEPKIKLRSLVVRERRRRDAVFIPANWISQFIGPTMQDLAFDRDVLGSSELPVLPDLEFLQVPATSRFGRIGQSVPSLLSKAPNLKDVTLELEAPPWDPSSTFPTYSRLQHIVCNSSWLRYLIPGSSVTIAKVSCDSQIAMQELSEILHEGSVPLRNLRLTYSSVRAREPWSPDDLEYVVRCFPELEICRIEMQDPTVASLQQAMFHISRLDKLRLISFGFPARAARRDFLDDAWQELKLREFLGRTKSRFLRRITFVGKGEWKLEKGRVWKLWEEGMVVRSVSL